MSKASEDVEFIPIEHIRPVPKQFQIRERHTPEDIKRLAEDIREKKRLTKPIRVVPLTNLYPSIEKYRGIYAIVGGTARIVACKVLGLKELQVGRDVYIENDIRTLQKYFDEVWLDNELTWSWSWIDRVNAAKQYTEFGWTQERIAERLGYQDNSMVSKLLMIARTLPHDVINDPFIEKLGPMGSLALSKMWAKNERDGRAHLERLRGQHGSGEVPSGVPSDKRLVEIAVEYEKTGSLAIAYGSAEFDNSPLGLEGRVDRGLRMWARKALEEGTAPPPFSSIAEARDARKTIDDLMSNSTSDPNLPITLEVIAREMQSLIKDEEDLKALQRQGMLVDVVKAQMSMRISELNGVVEKLKEPQHRSGPTTPTPGSSSHIPGLRRTFPERTSTH